MSEGKSLESLGEEFSTSVAEEFNEDEEDKRRNIVDSFFRENDVRLENYIDDYESLDSIQAGFDVMAVSQLYIKTFRIIKQVSGKARREYEQPELAEKWEAKAQEMHDLLRQHPDIVGLFKEDLSERRATTFVELIRKSSEAGRPKSKLKRVVDDLGVEMMQFTDWFFEGTEITTEGTTGGDSSVEGA